MIHRPDFRSEHVLRRQRHRRAEIGAGVWALLLFVCIGFALAPKAALNAGIDASVVHAHGPEAAAYALGR